MSSVIVNKCPANQFSIAEVFLVQINYMRKMFNLVCMELQQSVLQTAAWFYWSCTIKHHFKKVLIGSCGAGGNMFENLKSYVIQIIANLH